MAAKEDILTHTDIEVCEAFLADPGRNKTQLMFDVGKVPEGSARRAAAQASATFFRRPKIREYLDRRMEQLRARNDVQIDRWIQEVSRMAFLDPGDLVGKGGTLLPLDKLPEDARRCVTEVETTESGVFPAKVAGKSAALEQLAKFLGAYRTDNLQKAEAEREVAKQAAAEAAEVDMLALARRIAFIFHKASEGLNEGSK